MFANFTQGVAIGLDY